MPKTLPVEDLLTTTEAAAVLELERSTFFRWMQLGRIEPVMKAGGSTGTYLFRRSDVEALIPEAHPRPKKTS